MSERQANSPTLRALLPSRLVPEDMLSEWQGPNLPNTKNYAPPPDSLRGRMGDVLMQGIAALGGFTGLPMSEEGDRAALLGELLAAGMPLVGGIKALRGIKAFHGSPHDFDQFSLSKIGTGEGAQAYGHGLYFADEEQVARGYRDALSARNLPVGMPFDMMERRMKANPGRMYEVNIDADPEDFLDWDAPLSQQSEKVRQKLPAYLQPQEGESMGNSLRRIRIDEDPEESLRAAGIQGIKYLDEGSRGPSLRIGLLKDRIAREKAQGLPFDHWQQELDALEKTQSTRNYVVFDDKLISIVKKYGIAAALSGGLINQAQAAQLKEQGHQ